VTGALRQRRLVDPIAGVALREPFRSGKLVRSVKTILATGVLFTLLTVYIYVQASTDTFLIYLIALMLWASLFGYCVHSRAPRNR
jgi:hypothetical protein